MLSWGLNESSYVKHVEEWGFVVCLQLTADLKGDQADMAAAFWQMKGLEFLQGTHCEGAANLRLESKMSSLSQSSPEFFHCSEDRQLRLSYYPLLLNTEWANRGPRLLLKIPRELCLRMGIAAVSWAWSTGPQRWVSWSNASGGQASSMLPLLTSLFGFWLQQYFWFLLFLFFSLEIHLLFFLKK